MTLPTHSVARAAQACRLAPGLLALAIGSAHAQTAPNAAPPAPRPDDAPTNLQTVVVTAQKRLQTAQSVPVSLYSLSGQAIERSGITSVEELGNSVAGVSIGAGNPGALVINIRGVTDLAKDFQISNANGLYIDEAPLSGLAGLQPEASLWDVERVEVLRGPQGTLFGEGSMGGTIRIITRKPDASGFFGRVGLGYSSTRSGGSGYSASGSVNVPLMADTLALTAAVSRQQLPGWIDIPDLKLKDANDGTKTDARVALRYTPSRALTIDASVLAGRIDAGENGATAPGTLDPVAAFPGAAPVNKQPRNERTTQLGNLTVNYDLGALSLVSTSTLYEQEWQQDKDVTYIVPVFFGPLGAGGKAAANSLYKIKAFTQELRLASNGDQVLDWTAGLYYKDGENANRGGFSFDLPAWFSGPLIDTGINKLVAETKAYAVFGDVDYAFTDSLSLQAGLRYYREDKSFSVLNETSSAVFGTVAGTLVGSSGTASANSPKLGLTWKASKDVLLFGKVSKGFRGGGINALPNPAAYPGVPGGFEPESVIATELGVKAALPGGWYVNAYLYQNDWKDLQLGFVTADGLFSYTANAGKAKAKGGEIEIGGRVFTGFNLGLSLSVVDAKIGEDVSQTVTGPGGPTTRVIAKKGNRIPLTSKTKFGLIADYGFGLGETLRGQVTARYREASETFSEPENREAERNADSKQLYLRAALRGGSWELGVWGDNLLSSDSTSYRERPITAIPLVFSTYVRPRTLGVDFKLSF